MPGRERPFRTVVRHSRHPRRSSEPARLPGGVEHAQQIPAQQLPDVVVRHPWAHSASTRAGKSWMPLKSAGWRLLLSGGWASWSNAVGHRSVGQGVGVAGVLRVGAHRAHRVGRDADVVDADEVDGVVHAPQPVVEGGHARGAGPDERRPGGDADDARPGRPRPGSGRRRCCAGCRRRPSGSSARR